MGYSKLSVDVAVGANGSGIGFGGLIRDERGLVQGAFFVYVPNPYDPLTAECIALREGLLFARSYCLSAQVVETDCRLAALAINSSSPPLGVASVIDEIKLFYEIGGGSCRFIPRQGNKAAHTLARESLTRQANECWLDENPSGIASIVNAEAF